MRVIHPATVDAPSSRAVTSRPAPAPRVAYRTKRGTMYQGFAEDVLDSSLTAKHRHKGQLILTSPPFPLNRKKKYGNEQGDEYLEWLAKFGPIFKTCLRRNGSIVMEMGNAWESGEPVMSTLALRALLGFLDKGDFKLCQQFVCYNPARLPSPAQWVNVKRIRVKDAYTHVWWMGKTTKPKASNKRVLKEYSPSMKKLLTKGKYNHGRRPSEHDIGEESFLKRHEGAIPSNVLTFSNTTASDPYLKYCREHDLPTHPARMPRGLAEFFIRFLTEEDDLVIDPFAGSNITGAVAEELGRNWIAIEPEADYIAGSRGRFPNLK